MSRSRASPSPSGRRDSMSSLSSSLPKDWDARKFGDFMEGRRSQAAQVKRWDGAARTSSDWDALRRDPELWFRSGNCLVHLYGRGTSRRGPAFKVPLGALLAARCHPLVERFIGVDLPETDGSPGAIAARYADFERWSDANPTRRVDLYIPAPVGTDKTQAFQYHLATRNLFAWVFRRSVVGDHLGNALIGLLNSMHEFRLPGEDHLDDMLAYLDEEGYTDVAGQPHHALAILHLAEYFQLREPYVNAFAHCVGMSDRLFLSSEYQLTSSVSRRLIRRARVEMDRRLAQAGTMLRTFLEDELSETHLGLSGPARAHLERFRSFLMAFYASKLGYYPPPSINSGATIFEAEIYRLLHDDFEALYELLVDESFTSAESTPFLAQGGICTVQSVHSFDLRYRYKSLQHPLPLLPEVSTNDRHPHPRRLSWLAGSRDKLRPDQRLVAHAALVKASNTWKRGITQNDLVRAYRRFEEESLGPHSGRGADRAEKIGLVDARKVRWILVYSVYQVLRNIVLAPPEIRDAELVDYHVAISMDSIPPWKEDRALQTLLRRQTQMATQGLPSPAWNHSTSNLSSTATSPYALEIKPDVDYFAIAHRGVGQDRAATASPSMARPPTRANSLTRGFAMAGSMARSLSIFRRETRTPDPATQAQRKSMYHEIVVHGYGNGTNAVKLGKKAIPPVPPLPTITPGPPAQSTLLTNRSMSTSSNSSNKSGTESNGSTPSTASTAPSSAPPISPITPTMPTHQKMRHSTALPAWDSRRSSIAPETNKISIAATGPTIPPRGRRREVVSYMAPVAATHSSFTLVDEDQRPPGSSHGLPPPRPMAIPSVPAVPSREDLAYSKSLGDLSKLPSHPSLLAQTQPLNYAASYEALVLRQEEDFARDELCPSPLRIRKGDMDTVMAEEVDWTEFGLGDGMAQGQLINQEVQDEWERYTGLGGLRPVASVGVR